MLVKIPLQGSIVQEMRIKNTNVLICDAVYSGSTEQDCEAVLNQAARISQNILLQNQNRGLSK